MKRRFLIPRTLMCPIFRKQPDPTLVAGLARTASKIICSIAVGSWGINFCFISPFSFGLLTHHVDTAHASAGIIKFVVCGNGVTGSSQSFYLPRAGMWLERARTPAVGLSYKCRRHVMMAPYVVLIPRSRDFLRHRRTCPG